MVPLFRFVAIGFVLAAALALGSTVQAQPGLGGGPRPGLRPFGAPPPSVLPMLYGRLLTTPTVQKELNLTEDQEAKIKQATDQAQAAMRELFAGIRDLNPEQRQAKMEEAGKKMQAQAEETKKIIEGVLLPKQLERLKGIALQMAGVSAFTDKEVQRDLKLSDDQAAKIKTANDDLMTKAHELLREGADPQTLGPKMQQLRTDYEKQVMDVLTADQEASLEKMKGAKLEVPMAELRGHGAPAEAKGRP